MDALVAQGIAKSYWWSIGHQFSPQKNNPMNFLQLNRDQQGAVAGVLYGFFQNVEGKENRFAGKITLKTVCQTLIDQNPPCALTKGKWCISFEGDYYQQFRSACYESVNPANDRKRISTTLLDEKPKVKEKPKSMLRKFFWS